MDEWTDGRMDRPMDGWMDGPMDGWMDARTDGGMVKCVHACVHPSLNSKTLSRRSPEHGERHVGTGFWAHLHSLCVAPELHKGFGFPEGLSLAARPKKKTSPFTTL